MQQKIKVIVFDFDNTLYIGDIWTNLKEYMLERLESFLDKEEAKKILNESMELSGGKVKNDTIAFLVKQNGYEPKKLSDSIANNIYLHPNKVEVISNEFLKKLSYYFSFVHSILKYQGQSMSFKERLSRRYTLLCHFES